VRWTSCQPCLVHTSYSHTFVPFAPLLSCTVQVELKVKEDEIAQIKTEAMRVNKLREQTAKKIKQLEDQKADVEAERDTFKKVRTSEGHDSSQ
jgi:hypothetical protein